MTRITGKPMPESSEEANAGCCGLKSEGTRGNNVQCGHGGIFLRGLKSMEI